MVSGNEIEIIEEFKVFKLHDSFGSGETGRVKTVYKSSGVKKWVQRIEFYDKYLKQAVKLDLYGLKELTIVFSLNEKEIGDQFVQTCSFFNIDFKYQLKKHAFLCVENEERLASIALKKSQDGRVYLTIFMLDSGDSRRSPILYVHGIWKTSPANLFMNRLSQIS